jgi:hypothetical protein
MKFCFWPEISRGSRTARGPETETLELRCAPVDRGRLQKDNIQFLEATGHGWKIVYSTEYFLSIFRVLCIISARARRPIDQQS